MFHRQLFAVATFMLAACDTAPPPERLAHLASERVDDVSFHAFEAPDEGGECAVVLLDEVGSALVVGSRDVVAVCDGDGSACELQVPAHEAVDQACGYSADALVDHARDLGEDSEFRDWCSPEYQSCDPGDGYGCISPACKTTCARQLTRCTARCDGDEACIEHCSIVAESCFDSCCWIE